MARDQRRRLQEVIGALDRLATGEKMGRQAIFGKPEESWQARLMTRLMDEELVIRSGVGKGVVYEAVDGKVFAEMVTDEVRVAEWYFKRSDAILEELNDEHVPARAPATPIQIRAAPVPADTDDPLDPIQTPDPAQELQSEILKTVLLCAENLVYLRSRLDELEGMMKQLLADSQERLAVRRTFEEG